MRAGALAVLVMLIAQPAFVQPALAQQPGDGPYDIMRPERGGRGGGSFEPWLAPKYKSPRGTNKPVRVPRSESLPQARAATPPPIAVPETGRVLPNLPVTSGNGPGGRESFSDRAIRCTHQAGLYGPAAGDTGIYTRSCINQ